MSVNTIIQFVQKSLISLELKEKERNLKMALQYWAAPGSKGDMYDSPPSLGVHLHFPTILLHSLTRSLPHSLTPSHPHSLTPSLSHYLTAALPYYCTPIPIH